MRQKFNVLLMGAMLLITSKVFAADTYTIDPNHTSFTFTIKHMMISNVPGEFDKFSGTITYSPTDLANSKADVTIDVPSINTRIEKRDNHLKSPDFFDAAKFPAITFVSTKFTPTAITGNLTMKGISKEVTIPVTVAGPVDEMGHQAIGITGSLTINREDYGVGIKGPMDKMIGQDVQVNVSIEADKK